MTSEHDTSPSFVEPVGQVLGRLRRQRRLTGAELAERVGMSQPKISRIERGKGHVDPDDVDRIARELGADDQLIQQLIARAGSRQDWLTDWRPVAPGLAERQRNLGSWESGAESFRMFEPSVVTGLFQTSGYAHSVLMGFQRLFAQEGEGETEAATLEAVSGRIKRQEVVADRAKTFRLVLAEAVLAHGVGTPVDMLAQIEKLRKAATSENVSIKIVPMTARWPLVPLHGFMILDERAVFVDLYNTGLTSRGKLDLVRYANVFDAFDAIATEDIEPILAKYDSHYLQLLQAH